MQGASEPTPDEEPWPGVAEVGCGLESLRHGTQRASVSMAKRIYLIMQVKNINRPEIVHWKHLWCGYVCFKLTFPLTNSCIM